MTLLLARGHRTGTVGAVLSLAISIGLYAAVASATSAAYTRPLPFKNEDQLVTVVASSSSRTPRRFLTDSEVTALRSYTDIFADVTTIEAWPGSRRGWMDLSTPSRSVRVAGALILPNTFTLLGVIPVGRAFTSDDVSSGARVAIISEPFARRWFADERPLGHELLLNGEPFHVVGVLPPSFVAPVNQSQLTVGEATPIDVWIPQDRDRAAGIEGGGMAYSLVARITRGDRGTLSEEVSRRLRERLPRAPSGGYAVVPLRGELLGSAPVGLVAAGIVGLLLLAVAITNVLTACLLGIDAARGELMIRAALGGYGRQLWWPHLKTWSWMVVVAMGLGVFLQQLISSSIRGLLPLPPWPEQGRLEWLAPFLATAIAGLMAVIALWLLITIQQRQLSSQLLGIWSSARASQKPSRLLSVVTVTQIALAIGTLAPAVALRRTLADAERMHTRLDRSDVLVVEGWMLDRLVDRVNISDLRESFRQKIMAIPGVRAVGLGSIPPLVGGENAGWIVQVPRGDGTTKRIAAFGDAVDSTYLRLLGLLPIQGREFNGLSSPPGSPEAIVSTSFAAIAFADGNALGKTVDFGGARTIIGVVPDEIGRNGTAKPGFYIPAHDVPLTRLSVLVALSTPSEASAVVQQIQVADSAQPVDRVTTLATLTRGAFGDASKHASATGVLAVAAAALALSGLLLVASYWSSAASVEIAIRNWLGSSPLRTALSLFGRRVPHVGVGVAVGLPMALATTAFAADAVVPLPIATSASIAIASFAVALVAAAAVFAVCLNRSIGAARARTIRPQHHQDQHRLLLNNRSL